MKHNFDEIIDRRVSECKKYEPAYPKDVIPMWIADTDFAVPDEIANAIAERAKHPCYGYPVESFEFEKSAAGWEKKRFGWDVKPEWVKYSNGVLPFFVYAIRAFAYPGDKVLFQSPVYPPFYAITRNNGCHIVTNPLVQDEDGKYQIDFEDLEDKLKDPRVKLFFLCNPHNPVMRSYSLEELTKIGDLCLKHHVLVISDEIHCDLVYKGHKHIPFASISEKFADNSMVLINPSKTFNIAGFRTGAAIIPNEQLRNKIQTMIEDNKNYGRTIFGMLSFITAYNECEYYADEMIEYLEENQQYTVDFIKERIPRIKLADPEATYLLWLDCRDLKLSQPELTKFFFEKAKLGLNDGSTFGSEGIGFMRMNIACPKATLVEALNRLEKAVNELN
ncbi:MAG: pyridoxal phosphate-dependent aminotransferase [Lachnospiraceae bacterium]|nr:pyridoxal phosphate-dependent aminotransferase [Lachnospiraceae bacterium]